MSSRTVSPGHDFWSCIQCWPHSFPYPKHPMEFAGGPSVPVHEGCQLTDFNRLPLNIWLRRANISLYMAQKKIKLPFCWYSHFQIVFQRQSPLIQPQDRCVVLISLIYRLAFMMKLIFIHLTSMANFPLAVNLKDLYVNQSCISEFFIRGILKRDEKLFTSQARS